MDIVVSESIMIIIFLIPVLLAIGIIFLIVKWAIKSNDLKKEQSNTLKKILEHLEKSKTS
jgi:nitrogen fixation-related uncharacterized protein